MIYCVILRKHLLGGILICLDDGIQLASLLLRLELVGDDRVARKNGGTLNTVAKLLPRDKHAKDMDAVDLEVRDGLE